MFSLNYKIKRNKNMLLLIFLIHTIEQFSDYYRYQREPDRKHYWALAGFESTKKLNTIISIVKLYY